MSSAPSHVTLQISVLYNGAVIGPTRACFGPVLIYLEIFVVHLLGVFDGRRRKGLGPLKNFATLRRVGNVVGSVLELVLLVDVCAVSNERVQDALENVFGLVVCGFRGGWCDVSQAV